MLTVSGNKCNIGCSSNTFMNGDVREVEAWSRSRTNRLLLHTRGRIRRLHWVNISHRFKNPRVAQRRACVSACVCVCACACVCVRVKSLVHTQEISVAVRPPNIQDGGVVSATVVSSLIMCHVKVIQLPLVNSTLLLTAELGNRAGESPVFLFTFVYLYFFLSFWPQAAARAPLCQGENGQMLPSGAHVKNPFFVDLL